MKVTREDMQLYAVTDTQWLNGRDFYEEIEKVLAAGATFLQLREKDSTHEEIVKKALAIKPIARRYGVPFVIDDDIYAALEADVDGVHIGQSDIDAVSARKLLGDNKIIGVSARNLQEAKIAKENGADYLGIGAMFSTSTKSDAKLVSFNTLEEIIKEVNLPFVLIGGITLDNVKKLKHFKPDGYALVSGILGTDDISKRVEKWYERI